MQMPAREGSVTHNPWKGRGCWRKGQNLPFFAKKGCEPAKQHGQALPFGSQEVPGTQDAAPLKCGGKKTQMRSRTKISRAENSK